MNKAIQVSFLEMQILSTLTQYKKRKAHKRHQSPGIEDDNQMFNNTNCNNTQHPSPSAGCKKSFKTAVSTRLTMNAD
jgi:hypothetical protein